MLLHPSKSRGVGSSTQNNRQSGASWKSRLRPRSCGFPRNNNLSVTASHASIQASPFFCFTSDGSKPRIARKVSRTKYVEASVHAHASPQSARYSCRRDFHDGGWVSVVLALAL